MGYTEANFLEQLLWRPLSPVSYVLQLFVIGIVLAIVLRLVALHLRLTVLVFGLSAWFALLWTLSLPVCAARAVAPVMAAAFAVPALVSGSALMLGEPPRAPWVIGAVLVAAHVAHFAVTSSFQAILCL